MSSTAARFNAKKKPTGTRNDIVVLAAMCGFAFLVLGAFVLIKMLPDSELKIGAFLNSYLDQRNETSFTLGTVQLGTTIDQVRERHGHAVKGVTADGSITMAFLDGNDRYIVWYGEDGPRHIAYKARQMRELTGISEDEFIGSIAERYGAPSISTCSRRVLDGMRDCRFSWWIPGEVRMDVTSRKDPRVANPTLKVTLQITDTRKEGRLRRIAQSPQSVKTY